MAMNPVEQRVLQMCQAWAAFRDDPAARLLVWRIQEDALRMVDVFIEMQKHQTALTTGDTFVLLCARPAIQPRPEGKPGGPV
jgi:hypothetical protein